ncbi:gametogenetin-like [Canis lupus dingo]|uniref:gametogenetin-like n=1 Tax=Canis lupus dingo TaxID=286419 RepID=UPI0020C30541|nr:gametogenetin-like [Canis lupus dingo]
MLQGLPRQRNPRGTPREPGSTGGFGRSKVATAWDHTTQGREKTCAFCGVGYLETPEKGHKSQDPEAGVDSKSGSVARWESWRRRSQGGPPSGPRAQGGTQARLSWAFCRRPPPPPPPRQSPSIPIPPHLRATPCGSVNPISSARWIPESSSTGSSGLWRGPSHILGHQPHTQSRTISPSLAQRAYDRTALSLATSTSCCLATATPSPLHKGREAPSTLGGSKRVNGGRGLLPRQGPDWDWPGTGRLGAPDQGAGADTQGRGGKSPRGLRCSKPPQLQGTRETKETPRLAKLPATQWPVCLRNPEQGQRAERTVSRPPGGVPAKACPSPPHLPLPCPHSGNIL